MFWQTKLIEDGLIPLPGRPDDYDQHPENYLLKISRQGNQYFQKVFTPDPAGNPLVKEVAKPESIQEQLVIEEKLGKEVPLEETKKTPKKLDPNELKIIFHNLKADVHKQIDERVSEINNRIDKIEEQVNTIQTTQTIPQKSGHSRKLPRLVLSLFALTSFLAPFKPLHNPKIETAKVQTSKPVSKPKVYYRPVPKPGMFTPVYKLIKLFQDLIKPR